MDSESRHINWVVRLVSRTMKLPIGLARTELKDRAIPAGVRVYGDVPGYVHQEINRGARKMARPVLEWSRREVPPAYFEARHHIDWHNGTLLSGAADGLVSRLHVDMADLRGWLRRQRARRSPSATMMKRQRPQRQQALEAFGALYPQGAPSRCGKGVVGKIQDWVKKQYGVAHQSEDTVRRAFDEYRATKVR